MMSYFSGGGSEGVTIKVTAADDDHDHQPSEETPQVSNDPRPSIVVDPVPPKRKPRHLTENYQLFVNRVFQARRQKTLIWIAFVLILDITKLGMIVGCFAQLCSIHVGVIHGAWILETLVAFLMGLVMAIFCEIGFLKLLWDPFGFVNAECKVYCYLSFMMIGCCLQFFQIIPFSLDESNENSYQYNNQGGQELCRMYAHRKLKISFREETKLCAAWATLTYWRGIKITIAISLCINIISIICLTEYLCFAGHYYSPRKSVWREYINYCKMLAGQIHPPVSPRSHRSPGHTPSKLSSKGLTPTQSRLLNKFGTYEPSKGGASRSNSFIHLHIDS